MFGMGTIASMVGSFLGGPLVSMFSSVTDVFKSNKVQEAAEFSAMTQAQQSMYASAMAANAARDQAKVQISTTRMGQFMMFMYGVPPAIYLGTIYITAAFPWLGLHADPLKGDLGAKLIDVAQTIALSFFIGTPVVAFGGQLFASLASRLRA